MAEKEIAVVVHCAARNILSKLTRVYQAGHFLFLECGRIQPPHHPFPFLMFGAHRVINRIAPAGRHEVQLAVAGEGQTAAMVIERVYRDGWVALLGDRTQIFDPRPLSFVRPNAHHV